MSLCFRVGDKTVHPAHGVAEVTSIEDREIAGRRCSFYILRVIDSKMKVMVPLDGVDRLGLRAIMSTEDADRVLSVLKSHEVAVKAQPWNRRYREYTEMLNSGSPFEVAKVLRDLSRMKNVSDKDLSFVEKRLLDQARALVVSELALAHACEQSRMATEIDAILGAPPAS